MDDVGFLRRFSILISEVHTILARTQLHNIGPESLLGLLCCFFASSRLAGMEDMVIGSSSLVQAVEILIYCRGCVCSHQSKATELSPTAGKDSMATGFFPASFETGTKEAMSCMFQQG